MLVLTSSFPRYVGDSSGNFVYELSKKLSEKNVKIMVLCPHHPNSKFRENVNTLDVFRFPYFFPLSCQKLSHGGGMIYNWKNSYIAKIQSPFFFFSELFYTMKIISKEKILLIHCHWLIPQGLVGAICKMFFGIKHVLTVHAGDVFSLERLPFKMKITGFIMKNTDKIVVVSSYIGERMLDLVPKDLKENVKDKMAIFPMGVTRREYQHLVDDDEKLKSKYGINSKYTLLFIGRLVEKKGVIYLIEAMLNIISQFDANLIICGKGPLRKDLEKYVKEKSIENFVKFAGFINNHDKRNYLSLSEILIVPSIITQSGDTEGLPVVVLEGLAAGKPIIVSNVGGIKDVIQNGYNGFIVEPKNPEQIAEKISELLNNTHLRAKFSENALDTSKKYDWNVIVEKYVEIFRELMYRYTIAKYD